MNQTLYGVVHSGNLNLRLEANYTANILSIIPNNTLLSLTKYNTDWYKTVYGSNQGYVCAQFIRPIVLSSTTLYTGQVYGGRLNLRRSPSLTAQRLILIPDQTTLELVDPDANGNWYITTYNGYTGYIQKAYIIIKNKFSGEWAYGQVTSNTLNVRKSANISAKLWHNVLPCRRILLVKAASDDWYETIYRGNVGYVHSDFIKLLDEPVHSTIPQRMRFMAVPEAGRNSAVYFNGYTGEWCHRFADWLTTNAGQPQSRIPHTSNCAKGIIWFATNEYSDGFYFKRTDHKTRMLNNHSQLHFLDTQLQKEELFYAPQAGDYVYFRWANAPTNVSVSHVGIVDHVEPGTIVTIEGNVDNSVVFRSFSLDDERIIGYGKPRYETA